MFIGQKKLIDFIEDLDFNSCPRFIICKGIKGCGKYELTKLLANRLGVQMVEFSPKVEEVRHIINTIYTIKQPTLYFCRSLGDMSVSSKNSLLKVTEETPHNAIIVLHSQLGDSPTLFSRAHVFEFEPYSFEQMQQFADSKNLKIDEPQHIMYNCCDSPGELEYYSLTGKFKQAYELSNMVLDYIHEVSYVNAFKILDRLALKKDSEGIEPEFFLRVLLNCFVDRKGQVPAGQFIARYSIDALALLKSKVISRSTIMDNWVMSIMKGVESIC